MLSFIVLTLLATSRLGLSAPASNNAPTDALTPTRGDNNEPSNTSPYGPSSGPSYGPLGVSANGSPNENTGHSNGLDYRPSSTFSDSSPSDFVDGTLLPSSSSTASSDSSPYGSSYGSSDGSSNSSYGGYLPRGNFSNGEQTCEDQPTRLYLSDSPYDNYFYSDCNTAAQVVVTSPRPGNNLTIIGPRLVVAWPAGNSGVASFFAPENGVNGTLAIQLDNQTSTGNALEPVYLPPPNGSEYPSVGVSGVLRFNDTAVLTVPILGSMSTSLRIRGVRL